jgi:hypothetical protein
MAGKGNVREEERAFTYFVKRNGQGLKGKRWIGEDGRVGNGEWKEKKNWKGKGR